MTLSPVRRAFAAAFAALAAVSAEAMAPVPLDPELVKLDQTVQQLRQEVLRINAEAQAVEDALRYPALTRAEVLLGVAVSQLLVQEIRLQIDDRPVVSTTFSEATAAALLRSGGLQRVLRANLDPGVYNLKIEVEGRYADAAADAEPLKLTHTATIEKTLAPLQVEIALAPERSLNRRLASAFGRGSPALKVRSLEAVQP
jgi:hypothetical protein